MRSSVSVMSEQQGDQHHRAQRGEVEGGVGSSSTHHSRGRDRRRTRGKGNATAGIGETNRTGNRERDGGPEGKHQEEQPVFYSSFEEIKEEKQKLLNDAEITDADAQHRHDKTKFPGGVLRLLDEKLVKSLINQFVIRFPFGYGQFKYFALPKGHPAKELPEEEVHPYYQGNEDLQQKKLELRKLAFKSLSPSKQHQIRREMPLVPFFQYFRDNIRMTKYMLSELPNGFVTFVGSKDFIEHLASMVGQHEKEMSLQGCIAVPLTEIQSSEDKEALVKVLKERVIESSIFEAGDPIEIGHTLRALLVTCHFWKSQCEKQFSADDPLYMIVLLERKPQDRKCTSNKLMLKFDIPGGRRMATESTFECADRERQEEMALPPTVESSITDVILSVVGSPRVVTLQRDGKTLFLLCVPEGTDLHGAL